MEYTVSSYNYQIGAISFESDDKILSKCLPPR